MNWSTTSCPVRLCKILAHAIGFRPGYGVLLTCVPWDREANQLRAMTGSPKHQSLWTTHVDTLPRPGL